MSRHNRVLRWTALLLLSSMMLLAKESAPEIVASTKARGHFHPVFKAEDIPADLLSQVKQTTWHAGCPVDPSELELLMVSYRDYTGRPQTGRLIVNRAVSGDLRKVFRKLFRHGFLIEKMNPIEQFGGNDDVSMAANNTSSFNCRDITLRPGKFSNHSWGRAIDINPLTNPYVKGEKVLPPGGAQYLGRDRAYEGGILENSYIVKLFLKKGWIWGGSWTDRQDYQHFEKPDRRPHH